MQFLREKIAAVRQEPHRLRNAGLLLALTAAMVIGFAQIQVPGGGDDWRAFSDAARRMLGIDPGPMYNPTLAPGRYYIFNPPWIVIVLLPILLLPHQWGWAIGCTGMLFIAVLLLRRWLPKPGPWKVVMLLLSPPMVYTLLHGQVDVYVLGVMLLPAEWWWLGVLAKPQDAIGLGLAVPVSKWVRTGLVTGAVILATLILIPNWPQGLFQQPPGFMWTVDYNLWRGLWPFQLTVGAALLGMGLARKDERYLLSSSPFLSPYITTSSLFGPWLAALTGLNDWQAALVFATWWGGVVYRMLGGATF